MEKGREQAVQGLVSHSEESGFSSTHNGKPLEGFKQWREKGSQGVCVWNIMTELRREGGRGEMGEGREDEGMNGRAKGRGPSWLPAWTRLHHGHSRTSVPPAPNLCVLSGPLSGWPHLAQARGGQSDRHKGSLSQGGKQWFWERLT